MKEKFENIAREALKKIPSVDEILNDFNLPVPLDFYKYHINILLDKVRQKIIDGKINNNVREYVFEEIKMLRDKYGININFKLVYPIAIRMPEFFEKKNFFTYFGWKMIDMKLKARKLGMKMVFPLRPDPIQQDTMTGKISDHQPYIFDICHFLQAIEKEKQLDFALGISECIFGGVKNWNKDETIIKITSKIGLDFHKIKQRVLEDKDALVNEIKIIVCLYF